jgi:hypothetical protein
MATSMLQYENPYLSVESRDKKKVCSPCLITPKPA